MLGEYIQKLKSAFERDALRARFERYPLLQLLICEFWFRVAFVVFVFLGLALALCLPKIWRTSPDGFLPIVKVSVVDRLQAWSLLRTATKAEAAGNKELALYSLQGAVGNNIADANMIRRLIRFAIKTDDQLTHASAVIGQATWLMRLTKTNIVDLELAAEVFNKYRLPSMSLMLLEPHVQEFTDNMKRAYLKSLFESSQVSKFVEQWEKSPLNIRQDEEIKLFYAAYLAGWQKDSLAAQGRQTLASALENPSLEILSLRLSLQVSAQLSDLIGYQKILARLEKKKADLVLEHITQWKLLVGNGQKAEASAMAKSFTNAPLTAMEAQELSVAYKFLELPEKARQTLEQSMERFSYSPGLWESMADIMINAGQWHELQALALRIRDDRSVRDTMAGYSYYLEGRAQLGLSRPNEALASFKMATTSKYDNLSLAIIVADNLIKLKKADLVKEFLSSLEAVASKELVYWQIVFNMAYQLKDDKLLLRAAANALKLNPNNPMAMNNYSAALLLMRQNPDEAIKITKHLAVEIRGNSAVLLNHCFALLLNHRTQEAESALKALTPAKLSPEEINDYHLAWFEVYLQKKQWDMAGKEAASIATDGFFPTQRAWFDQAVKSLPSK